MKLLFYKYLEWFQAPPSYKEPDFETRALQHSRVKLTWDEDEPERKKVLRRKFTDDQVKSFFTVPIHPCNYLLFSYMHLL